MFGVACRTSRQLHLTANKSDNGVIGNAPFARTVVIHNITQADLALFHESLSCVGLVPTFGTPRL
jgi:hypothetical protein